MKNQLDKIYDFTLRMDGNLLVTLYGEHMGNWLWQAYRDFHGDWIRWYGYLDEKNKAIIANYLNSEIPHELEYRMVVRFEYKGIKYDGVVLRYENIEYNCDGYWDAWLDLDPEVEWPNFRITGKTDKDGNPTDKSLVISAAEFEDDNEEHYIKDIQIIDLV